MTDHDHETGEVQLSEPRRETMFSGLQGQEVIPPGMALTQRQVSDLFGQVQVAQLVPVPRNVDNIMNKMTVLAARFGDRYIYSWEVKNKSGGKDLIEGGTVDLAYDLAREYGNNNTDVRALDFPTYIEFYARFTDLETGYSTMRSFRQRKNQTAGGRMDADRQLDITYQIGQSKAIRNVILKALNTYAEYCIEEAKRGMFEKVKKDPDKYRAAIERAMEKFEIALKDVERSVSRVKAEWTVRDIASVFAKMKSIDEGMASPTDVFPKETGATPTPTREKTAEESAGDQSDTETGTGAQPAEASGRSDARSTGKSPASDQTPAETKPKEPEKKTEPPKETKAEGKTKKQPAKRPGALFPES